MLEVKSVIGGLQNWLITIGANWLGFPIRKVTHFRNL